MCHNFRSTELARFPHLLQSPSRNEITRKRIRTARALIFRINCMCGVECATRISKHKQNESLFSLSFPLPEQQNNDSFAFESPRP